MSGLKVVHIVEGLGVGGVSSVVADLAVHQARLGLRPAILTLGKGGREDEVRGLGLPVYGRNHALRLIRQADVIHAHQRGAGSLAVMLGHGGRTIEHVHNLVSGRSRTSFRGTGVVVAISETVANHLAGVFPQVKGRLRVIENAVSDPGSVRFEPNMRARPLVVGAGRLEEQKDPAYFVAISRQMAVQGVDFVWYGSGPLGSVFDRPGRPSLCGFVSPAEFLSVLRSADALLVTSKWEGTPLVALDALSVGTPVAMTGASDLADTIVGAGAGVRLPFDAPDVSANSLLQLVGARTEIRKAANRLYGERFRMEDRIQTWIALYRTVAGK